MIDENSTEESAQPHGERRDGKGAEAGASPTRHDDGNNATPRFWRRSWFSMGSILVSLGIFVAGVGILTDRAIDVNDATIHNLEIDRKLTKERLADRERELQENERKLQSMAVDLETCRKQCGGEKQVLVLQGDRLSIKPMASGSIESERHGLITVQLTGLVFRGEASPIQANFNVKVGNEKEFTFQGLNPRVPVTVKDFTITIVTITSEYAVFLIKERD